MGNLQRLSGVRRARQRGVIAGPQPLGSLDGAAIKADMLLPKEQIDAAAGTLDNREFALGCRKRPIAQRILQK